MLLSTLSSDVQLFALETLDFSKIPSSFLLSKSKLLAELKI